MDIFASVGTILARKEMSLKELHLVIFSSTVPSLDIQIIPTMEARDSVPSRYIPFANLHDGLGTQRATPLQLRMSIKHFRHNHCRKHSYAAGPQLRVALVSLLWIMMLMLSLGMNPRRKYGWKFRSMRELSRIDLHLSPLFVQ